MPGGVEQSTKRQRQEIMSTESQSSFSSSSSSSSEDASVQASDPQIQTRQLSLTDREESIQKRHRSVEVNAALAIAGGDSRNDIETLTKAHKAPHTVKIRSFSRWTIWCSGGRRQAAATMSSLDTLRIKTATGRNTQSEICRRRISTNGQFRCRF